MKKLMSAAIAMIIATACYAQNGLPPNSIKIIDGIYGNKNGIKETRKAIHKGGTPHQFTEPTDDCICDLQATCNNSNTLITDYGANNIFMYHSLADATTYSIFEWDGNASWYQGVKIFDCGHDPAGVAGLGYVHLFDATSGNLTASMGGDAQLFLINPAASSNFLQASNSQLVLFNGFLGGPSIGLYDGSTPSLVMYHGGKMRFYNSSATYYSDLFPNSFTANRGVMLPDEGTGSGIASTLVTHQTKDDIQVNPDGIHISTLANSQIQIQDATASAWLKTTDITLKDASGQSIGLQLNSGIPTLSIFRAGTGFESDFTATNITASHNYKNADGSGFIPVNVADGNFAGQTTSILPICTYTVPSSDHTFRIGSYTTTSAIGIGSSVIITVNWTDQNGVAQALQISSTLVSPFFNSAIPRDIRAKGGTTVSVAASLTGTATYDVGAAIMQLN